MNNHLSLQLMRPYENLTDSELLTLLRTGDQQAFEIIYRRYVQELYRYARKNIGNKEDCEEIVQDVFVSLWARHQSLNIKALRSYLFNSVRYKIIRYFNHQKVKRKYEEHYCFFEVMYDTLPVEERAHVPSLQDIISKNLPQLPERCQMAIRLRLTENLSNAEIAQRMNIAKETVEMYMHKAFAHLRAAYKV